LQGSFEELQLWGAPLGSTFSTQFWGTIFGSNFEEQFSVALGH